MPKRDRKIATSTSDTRPVSATETLLWASASAVLLWLSRPPLGWWPCAFVALIPLLELARRLPLRDRNRRFWLPSRHSLMLWIAGSALWLVSLEGLRHANPLMYAPWIALSLYLGIYLPMFVSVARVLGSPRIGRWPFPALLAAPVALVTVEVFQNYVLTGISAAMLGHGMADVPSMIQIADLFGTYGVGFVVAAVNVMVWHCVLGVRKQIPAVEAIGSTVAGIGLLAATLIYGNVRLDVDLPISSATIALVQRDEQTEYGQSREREEEIFNAYAQSSFDIASRTDRPIDAFVWPESMMTGGLPWMQAGETGAIDPEGKLSEAEFTRLVEDNQRYFRDRVGYVQRTLGQVMNINNTPQLIGGCGVIRYDEDPAVMSGLINVLSDGSVGSWYGKTHLVICGEYIPIVSDIPAIRDLIAPGLIIKPGQPGVTFSVGDLTIAPNICIETAVERVTIDQMHGHFQRRGALPDAIVTVTNDAWFDRSAVVAHHLRCAQLVAVGCRRPILSAANGGPTAWVDSSGRIVDRLDFDQADAILVSPALDERVSLYVRLGDWPAIVCAVLSLLACFVSWRRSQREAVGSRIPEAV